MRHLIPNLIFTFFYGSAVYAGVCDSGRDTQKILCNGTNQIRAENGVRELHEDSHLDRMADDYAYRLWQYNGGGQGMALTHEIPGHEFALRMRDEGVAMPCAENIAVGQHTMHQVLDSWHGSPGHFANMINGQYQRIGNGYYKGFWVQIFSR